MPISGSILGQQILAEMNSRGMPGLVPYTPQFTNAVGTGIANGLLAATYTGVSTGLGLGAGVSTGAITGPATIPASLSALMIAALVSNGMPGSPHTLPFVDAFSTAIAQHIGAVIITGSSTVVASGTGTGTIVGITGPGLSSLIQTQLELVNMGGAVGYPKISTAIGNAVATAILSSVVNTTIVGVPVGPPPPPFTPIPSVGVDSGVLT